MVTGVCRLLDTTSSVAMGKISSTVVYSSLEHETNIMLAKINVIIEWSNINRKNVLTMAQIEQFAQKAEIKTTPKKLSGIKLLWHKTPEPIRKFGRKILGI